MGQSSILRLKPSGHTPTTDDASAAAEVPASGEALRVVGISGSTRRPSRTTALIEAIATEVARGRKIEFELFDLAGIGPGLGAFAREDLALAVSGRCWPYFEARTSARR